MKEENKHCYNCTYYRPFYTKEYTYFDRQDIGLCMRTTVVKKHNVCERWNYNNDFNKRIKKQFMRVAVVKALDEVTKNLTEIGQILKEENGGEQN